MVKKVGVTQWDEPILVCEECGSECRTEECDQCGGYAWEGTDGGGLEKCPQCGGEGEVLVCPECGPLI